MNSDKRDEIQGEGFNAWFDNNKRGTVEMSTGTGKTFIGLHALHSMPPDDKINLYLAETSERKKDLLKTIKKYDNRYGCNTLVDYNLQFHCYQSVYKWENTPNLGLIIADEIHDALTPEYSKFFDYNDYDAIIGLSAKVDINTKYKIKRGVLSFEINKEFYLKKYAPIIYKYSIDDSMRDNISRNLKVHLIYHNLNDKKKTVAAGKKNKNFFQTETQNYKYWDDRYANAYKIKNPEKRDLEFRICSSKRTMLLYNLPSKVLACRKLLTNLDRTLLFGNSIDALLKVTPYVVSSRNKDGQNDYFRRNFEEGEINTLASFKKLKQGANINDLLNIVIMSYYSSEKDLIQRFGRFRKDGDKEGNIFIFVTGGTQEVLWYNKMIENIGCYELIRHRGVDKCIEYLNKQTHKN